LCIDILYYIFNFIEQRKLFYLKINKYFIKILDQYIFIRKIVNPIVRLTFPNINYGCIAIFQKNQNNNIYIILTMIANNSIYSNIFLLLNVIKNNNVKHINTNNIKIHCTEIKVDKYYHFIKKDAILIENDCIQKLISCYLDKNKKIYCNIHNNYQYMLIKNKKCNEIFKFICQYYF